MADKRICPGCNAYLSSVREAFDAGLPCPQCGLSAAASAEIEAIQERQANSKLRDRLTTALKERDQARAELALLDDVVSQMRGVMEAMTEQMDRVIDRQVAITAMVDGWRRNDW